MATALWGLGFSGPQPTNPIVPTAPDLTVQSIRNYHAALPIGVGEPVTLRTSINQVAATATLSDNGLTSGDVAGAAINGVAATATYASSINNTFLLIKNKINAGGNTPDDLITKAAYATRYFTVATATFTMASVAAGAATVVVDGTTVSFTATGTNATDAIRCAAAINADASAGAKVIASASGAVCTVTGRGNNRATLTISSATVGIPFGATIAGVPVLAACGTVTMSGTSNATTGYIIIDGNRIAFTEGASDTASAVAAAAAVNASVAVNGYVTATNVAGVLILAASGTGFHLATTSPTVAAKGITLSVSGTGLTADDAVITGSSDEDSTDAIALAIVINKTPALAGIASALVTSTGVVTVFSTVAGDQMPAVGARGTGMTVGGVTTPLTTLTLSGASGIQSIYINGVLVATYTYATSVTASAAALVALINKNFYARTLVKASNVAGVITIAPTAAVSLATTAVGVTASAAYLTASGTYGGIAGNALTTTTATSGITAGAATLAGGMSGVLVTCTQPGVSGNWITFAANGAAAAHVTASGARLGASPTGIVVAGAETVETFNFS